MPGQGRVPLGLSEVQAKHGEEVGQEQLWKPRGERWLPIAFKQSMLGTC